MRPALFNLTEYIVWYNLLKEVSYKAGELPDGSGKLEGQGICLAEMMAKLYLASFPKKPEPL